MQLRSLVIKMENRKEEEMQEVGPKQRTETSMRSETAVNCSYISLKEIEFSQSPRQFRSLDGAESSFTYISFAYFLCALMIFPGGSLFDELLFPIQGPSSQRTTGISSLVSNLAVGLPASPHRAR